MCWMTLNTNHDSRSMIVWNIHTIHRSPGPIFCTHLKPSTFFACTLIYQKALVAIVQLGVLYILCFLIIRMSCLIKFFFCATGEVADKLIDIGPDVSKHSKQDHSTSFPQAKPQTKVQRVCLAVHSRGCWSVFCSKPLTLMLSSLWHVQCMHNDTECNDDSVQYCIKH